MVCLSRSYQSKVFKGCLPQVLLGPFLNSLSRIKWSLSPMFILKSFKNSKIWRQVQNQKCFWSNIGDQVTTKRDTFIINNNRIVHKRVTLTFNVFFLYKLPTKNFSIKVFVVKFDQTRCFFWNWSHLPQYEPPSFLWGDHFHSHTLKKGGSEKMSAWGSSRDPAMDICQGAYYVSCQKRLENKICLLGLNFKCYSLSVLAKQPINV